jgi:hypothetical protein
MKISLGNPKFFLYSDFAMRCFAFLAGILMLVSAFAQPSGGGAAVTKPRYKTSPLFVGTIKTTFGRRIASILTGRLTTVTVCTMP